MLRPGKQNNNNNSSSSSSSSGGYYGSAHYGGYPSTGGGGGGGGGGGYGVASGAADSYGPKYSNNIGNYNNHKSKRRGGSSISFLPSLTDPLLWAGLVSVLLFLTTLYYRSVHNSMLSTFGSSSLPDALRMIDKTMRDRKRWQRESEHASDMMKHNREETSRLEAQTKDLRKEQDELRMKFEQEGGGGPLSKEELEKLKQREEAWKKQVAVLQNATQRESRREALERFGPGPHRVKFSLRYSSKPISGDFVVEMAPLDEMPHAVHLFLEQVHHELWDHTWFYLNGPHVMQAGPQDWEGDEETSGLALRKFQDKQLDTLAFPEYSHNFPHVPLTLGFTGRPGGPDFYINKADNTEPHGPGGQFQHDLEEQADPCFAKIVEGTEFLQRRIFTAPVYGEDTDYAYFMTEPIEIVTVRIIEPNMAELEQQQQQQSKEVPPQQVQQEVQVGLDVAEKVAAAAAAAGGGTPKIAKLPPDFNAETAHHHAAV